MTGMTPPARRPFNWRLFWTLLAMMAFGMVAVLPYTLTLQASALEKATLPLPLPVLITVQTVQGLIIYGVLALVGLFLADRIGLGLPILAGRLRGESVREPVKRMLGPAIAIGVVGAAAVILLQAVLFGPIMDPHLQRLGIELPENLNPPAWQGFLASFYGGVVEEVLLRLFLLTLLAWLGSKVSRRADGRPTTGVLWVANVLAAVLFGLGHLPTAATIGLPLDALVVTQVVVNNALLGLAFGWLYWTYGLESAMLSHFSADIVLHVIVPLVLPLLAR